MNPLFLAVEIFLKNEENMLLRSKSLLNTTAVNALVVLVHSNCFTQNLDISKIFSLVLSMQLY